MGTRSQDGTEDVLALIACFAGDDGMEKGQTYRVRLDQPVLEKV